MPVQVPQIHFLNYCAVLPEPIVYGREVHNLLYSFLGVIY